MLPSRSGWLLVGLALASVALLAPEAASLAAQVGGPDFPHALVASASLVQLALSTWVLAVVILSQVNSTAASAFTPVLLRRALFAGAAGALAVAPAGAEREATTQPASVEHSLDGLRLPDRPTSTSSVAAVVIVRPGDTLWAIAARSLPAGAGNAEIASACARWHTANRAVIGADPDQIHPQQRLVPPEPARTPLIETLHTKDVP